MSNSIDPKALFLGPYSENQAEFREYVDFLLNDIIQWRRNYHPTDDRLINADDKENEEWKSTKGRLQRELDILLGDMKKSIPFHNPRFIGHMHSDLALPAILGYMAGQLYNQNNVVGESSPVTTEKELHFINYLCEMVHYPIFEYELDRSLSNENNLYRPEEVKSTGHLTSGGTTANIEALWTARNIKYYALSVKLLLYDKNIKQNSKWNNILEKIGELKVANKELQVITFTELFKITPADTFELHKELSDLLAVSVNSITEAQAPNEAEFSFSIKKWSVRKLGVHGIHKVIREIAREELDYPYLLIPQSRHYSWEKAMDILGLGSAQIKYIKVDGNFKTDTQDLEKICNGTPNILMVVSVVGTTEEGVVDPVATIAAFKNRYGFWLHLDAAYGGYYISYFNNVDGGFRTLNELKMLLPAGEDNRRTYGANTWFNTEDILNDFKALQLADSITVDPHKMGYIPYAVGAILYKDHRSKPFIEKKAPYLSSRDSEVFDSAKLYLGGSALEGSRSGAAALACYLSARVIPSHIGGYGRIMAETFKNIHVFLKEMFRVNKSSDIYENGFSLQIHPLYDSLTNIVCYCVGVKDVTLTPDDLNSLTNQLYQEMSAEKNKLMNDYKFIVSQTSLEYAASDENPGYATQIDEFLGKFGITFQAEQLKSNKYELKLLRSTLMNPLLSDSDRSLLFADFFKHLQVLVNRILPEIILEKSFIKGKNGIKQLQRTKALWIDNQFRIEKLRDQILLGGLKQRIDISRFLDIDFVSNIADNISLRDYNVFIVDLNLADNRHKEWQSGIDVLKQITQKCSSANILVYSQFLNPNFKIINSDGSFYPVKHNAVIGNFLKHYFNLTEKNLVPKTISPEVKSENKLTEMRDLDILIIKLAKLLFEKLTLIK